MKPNITEVLKKVAKKHREKTAIIDPSRSVTFGEFDVAVRKTARRLAEKGIKHKDRVLVLVPLSIDLYRITIALNYIGAAAIFIEDWITFTQIKSCVELSPPDAVISNVKGLIYSCLNKSLRKIPLKLYYKKYQKYAPVEDAPKLESEDEAIISFSSGTSGKPKMLARNFEFLNHQFYTLREVKKSTFDEVELLTMPVFLFINLAMGSTSVIADFNKLKPDHIDIQKIEKQLSEYPVNAICASPSFLLKLANQLNVSKLKTKIEKITTGGAPVFPNNAKLLNQHFPNARINIIYGSSEAEPISVVDSIALAETQNEAHKGLNVGKIHPETVVKIEPVFENLKIDSNIHIGEILVSGPNVLKKKDGNYTNQSIIDGEKWHRTGDSGYLNENKELVLTGPVSSIIPYKGQLWSPFIFEGLSKNINGVQRATLVKVDKQLIGVVQAIEEADPTDIRHQLTPMSIPFDSIVFIKNFPKDLRHDGKIKYGELELMIKKSLQSSA